MDHTHTWKSLGAFDSIGRLRYRCKGCGERKVARPAPVLAPLGSEKNPSRPVRFAAIAAHVGGQR